MPGPPVLKGPKFINAKTDLIIIGKICEYRVHRIVILCISPYFQTFFRYNSSFSEGYYRIDLKDIPNYILIEIINYAYNGKIDISEDNAEDLLTIADKYNIIGIVKMCAIFLWERIDSQNSIKTYLLAHYYNCQQLESTVESFIRENKIIDPNEELTIELALDLWHKQISQ